MLNLVIGRTDLDSLPETQTHLMMRFMCQGCHYPFPDDKRLAVHQFQCLKTQQSTSKTKPEVTETTTELE